ncbi:unnamed protein product, partial [Cyprideis torosa]
MAFLDATQAFDRANYFYHHLSDCSREAEGKGRRMQGLEGVKYPVAWCCRGSVYRQELIREAKRCPVPESQAMVCLRCGVVGGDPLSLRPAPEVIMSLPYDNRADLWSLGTIVFQCLTGKAPFQAPNPQALKQFYEKSPSTLRPKIPSGTSHNLSDLLSSLLKRDSKDRITLDKLRSHPFLEPSRVRAAPLGKMDQNVEVQPFPFPAGSPTTPPSPTAKGTPKNAAAGATVKGVSSPCRERAVNRYSSELARASPQRVPPVPQSPSRTPRASPSSGSSPPSSGTPTRPIEEDFVFVSRAEGRSAALQACSSSPVAMGRGSPIHFGRATPPYSPSGSPGSIGAIGGHPSPSSSRPPSFIMDPVPVPSQVR